jgi:riboflavin synthase
VFTGIIAALGKVQETRPEQGNIVFTIACPFVPGIGESIAVDGVCLTVKENISEVFRADAVAETVGRTTLKLRRAGDSVNLERALLPTDRLGGHFVAGHIDEVGKVLNVRVLPGSRLYEFGVSPSGSRLVANKGSIAIDGISLTVAEVHGTRVMVSVIPFTAENTTLKLRRVGDDVNVEFDLIAKQLARLHETRG